MAATHLFTIQEALDILEKSKHWLVKHSGLSAGCIDRAMDDSPCGLKTHVTSAAAIADALGLKTEDIRWPRGLSETGRNAHTGSSNVIQLKKQADICDICNLEVPVIGVCASYSCAA